MKIYDNNLTYLDINEAKRLLKNGYVLSSNEDSKRHIFIYENNVINIYSSSYKISLSLTNFIENYKDFKFTLIDVKENENALDLLKDEQYYSKIQKKQ